MRLLNYRKGIKHYCKGALGRYGEMTENICRILYELFGERVF